MNNNINNDINADGISSIVFATNNSHKLTEARHILGDDIRVLSLADIGCHEDISETANTLEGNAIIKARYVSEHYGIDCFADDTGLEVAALGGEPGVRSARYDDNTHHDSQANMSKLLRNLEGKDSREAQFRTVIALHRHADHADMTLFEGIVKGHITRERHGSEGFGYDPIFVPEGHDKTFAELGADIKDTISHRAIAIGKLARYLKLNDNAH